MTRHEFAANLQLAAAAQRVHVGAHFAKRSPARQLAPADIDWHRVALAVMVAAPALASFVLPNPSTYQEIAS